MAETLAIIDYGSGNLRSVEKAFERAARESGRAVRISVTDEPDRIAGADRIVLPGVGAFAACMNGLKARDGVIEAMEHAALAGARPFLGICVGMQLMAERGLEFGGHTGLGWIPGEVREIDFPDVTLPHMGWNTVTATARRRLPQKIDGAAFYFAHSYHFAAENDQHVIALTHHGGPLVAGVRRDNLIGFQFHPEKSQSAGVALLSDFLAWEP
ncbi:MAG: imidazole glycerol phosphate synthase subunit HisH [Pseudomonadota bacterium]